MTEEAIKELENLLSPVEWDKVVRIDDKKMLSIGDHPIEPARLSNLHSEAKFLLESDLWKLLYHTPKALAEKKMFVESQTLDDLKMGKSMLFILSQQLNIINIFANRK